YSAFGPTELDNLCLVCRVHHAMVTDEGWRILGGPGRWRLYPPTAKRQGSGAAPGNTGPPVRSP
ncbi:MAG: hypothetical protein ACRDNS_26425, partial [Trebonia sp.]